MASATLTVSLFTGERQPIAVGVRPLITIADRTGKQVFRDYRDGAISRFTLPFHNDGSDAYGVIAFTDGYEQAGFFPVELAPGLEQTVDLMLLRKDAAFNFRDALWPALRASHQQLAGILAHGAAGDDAAGQRYTDLLEGRPKALASLLNLATAMKNMLLPRGTPLDYLKEVIWDDSLAQDRFFGWADAAMIDQVKQGAAEGEFSREVGPGLLHPGATASWKQVQFGEANVQLTFHEGDRRTVDGVECVKFEPDMDYYKDPLAHVLLEVVANGITGALTEPRQVYVLRWMAGRHAGVAEFEPPYFIV